MEGKPTDRRRLLGYSLLGLGLAIVVAAVVIAFGFLTGYIAAPSPYRVGPEMLPGAEQQAIGVTVVVSSVYLANAVLISGLLMVMIWGGGQIAGNGVQLLKASPAPRTLGCSSMATVHPEPL